MGRESGGGGKSPHRWGACSRVHQEERYHTSLQRILPLHWSVCNGGRKVVLRRIQRLAGEEEAYICRPSLVLPPFKRKRVDNCNIPDPATIQNEPEANLHIRLDGANHPPPSARDSRPSRWRGVCWLDQANTPTSIPNHPLVPVRTFMDSRIASPAPVSFAATVNG